MDSAELKKELRKDRVEAFKPLFYPRSVAVVGATSNSKKMGCHVLKSLMRNFPGKIYPINPNYATLFGLKAYPSLKDVPGEIDLAVLVVQRHMLYDVIRECIEKGVRALVIVTAGFREAEVEDGSELHRKLAELVNSAGIKVIGPNTFGMVNTHADLNASFTPVLSEVKKGSIALVSQSGGVCHLLFPYAIQEGIGLSKIVGLGNRLNVDFADMLEYLAFDEETRSIALYVEGIDNPREMIEVAREVVKRKPVVAYKAGRFEAANRAAKSHTGSLAGNYAIYKSAFRQAGIIVVEDLIELISSAKALALQKPPEGRNVAVVSLVAGLGMVASDVCEESGLKLVEFTEETKEEIFRLLPPYTIRTNPVDLGFVANDPDVCGEVIKAVFNDRNVQGVVLNYIYSWGDDFLKLPIDAIIEAVQSSGKPVTMCLKYPLGVWDREKERLEENGVPTFPTPELASRAMAALAEYGEVRRKLSR